MKRLLLVVFLCAFVLAVVPATANAHVMKKHRAAYKRTLTLYPKQWKSWTKQRETLETTLNGIRDQMEELNPSDPDYQTKLQALEAEAKGEHDTNNAWLTLALPNLDKRLTSFTAGKVKWFKSKSDKKRFRNGMRGVKGGFDLLFSNGFGDLIKGAGNLSTDDVTDYATQATGSDNGQALGGARFAEGMATLKKLV